MRYGPYEQKTPRKVLRKRVRAAAKGNYYIGKQGQPIGNAYAPRYGVYNSGDSRKRS